MKTREAVLCGLVLVLVISSVSCDCPAGCLFECWMYKNMCSTGMLLPYCVQLLKSIVDRNCVQPEMNPCDPDPCENGGTCDTDSPFLFNCTCPPEYEGDTCGILYYDWRVSAETVETAGGSQTADDAVIQCNASRFYTISGKCNNLVHPKWGAAFQKFERELPNAYHDGKIIPRLYGDDGVLLPSARDISTRCFEQVFNETDADLHPNHNQNVMQFGQYLSHDLGLTPVMQGVNCCQTLDENGIHPHTLEGKACYPITISGSDRYFNRCMNFERSVHEFDQLGVAQQLNSATHYIDQSTVYGSTEKFAHSIRSFKNGLLRTDEHGMLPQDDTQKCIRHQPLKGCPVAGDNRCNVFPGLTTTHLIFHLEHNRVAGKLLKRHPEWDDEMLYKEARAIVIAETQNLVYEEYLPVILGEPLMRLFGLLTSASYDPTLHPGIINSFLTAAFRFGHSQINNMFMLNPSSGKMDELKDTFFRPDKLFDPVTHRPIYKELFTSLLTHRGQTADNRLAHSVLDLLFLNVDSPGASSDLPARNIQRGRDHGLPPYLDFRDKALAFLGNSTFFSELLLPPECSTGLYRSMKDIDLFLGGLSERRMADAQVGPTFGYLIGKQFKNLREGDRLFFNLNDSQAGFSSEQVESIKKTSFAGIICRTTKLNLIQKRVFKMPSNTNPLVNCSSIPDLDFDKW